MLVIIDNYDSFTHNLVQAFGAMGRPPAVIRNDERSVEQLRAMRPTGLVVSPGPGRPEDAGISKDAVRALYGRVPILGVCLGHQCLASVRGARIVASSPLHGRASDVFHSGAGIFDGVPSPFRAARYHSLVVDPDSLDESTGLEVCARTRDGVIMAIHDLEARAFGVQFHPESFLSPYGPRILRNFVRQVRPCATSPTS